MGIKIGKLFKGLVKGVSSLIPFGGVVGDILSPDKTLEEKKDGLALLDPIAQYNRTMARPRIAIGIVFVYLFGVIIQWGQKLFGVHTAYVIVIPAELMEFAKIVVSIIVGTRGIEKIAGKIFEKKK